MDKSQHKVVATQFGDRATSYVTSRVHAQGADLDWIEDSVRTTGDSNVLDLGCGGGHVSYRVAPHVAQVTACDLSDQMLGVVQNELDKRGISNVRLQQSAAEALPFKNDAFDTILCRFSAHHWSDLDAGLREIARTVRPRGKLLLIDGCSPGTPLLDTYLQTIEVLRDPSHVRDYSVAEWTAALTRAGLTVRTLQTHRLRMEFASWIERMRTPDVAAEAVRYLQRTVPQEVARHFAIEPDGSFMLDTLWIEAVRA